MHQNSTKAARLAQAILLALSTTAAQAAPSVDAPERVDTSALATSPEVARLIVTLAGKSDVTALHIELERVGSFVNRRLIPLRQLATGGWLIEARDSAKSDQTRPLARDEAELAMYELARNPALAAVEPDRLLTRTLTPNDERYPSQWAYFRSRYGTNAAGAWHYSTGAGIKIAVIDTGITPHSDLDANVLGGYDFITNSTVARDGDGRDPDPNDEGDWYDIGDCSNDPGGSENSSWHGSHVAGIAAAATNNSFNGTAGMAYDAKIVPVRVLGRCGGSLSDVAEAIVWASGGSVAGIPANPNPAQVINLSLGGQGSCSTTMQNAINTAVGNGAVVVVAAGNASANVAGFTPARCNNVVAVAATTTSGALASYSNYGDKIDVSAPGEITSTVNTGTETQVAEGYASYSGTSMAAPQVAGLAAMIRAKGTFTPLQVENLIKYNGTAALDCAFDSVKSCGWGLIDALHTLRAVGQGFNGDVAASPSPASFFKPTFFENANNYHLPSGSMTASPNTVWGQYGTNAPSSMTVKFTLITRNISVVDPKKYKIELIAPDGSVVKVLHDNAASFVTTQTVNASSEIADGLWKLRVTNSGPSSNLYIDKWSLGFPGWFTP
ncbi:MAG: S8 family serine peptidase [Rhodanobacteraceae bacterium]|nr:S8 family serine peptidase [Rhodanobacteraceae bacterium]